MKTLAVWFLTFLASPVRVLTTMNRVFVLIGFFAPLYYFGWPILPLMLIFGLAFDIALTLVTYGADNMIRKQVPWKLWLWRHVEVWWVNPEEIE